MFIIGQACFFSPLGLIKTPYYTAERVGTFSPSVVYLFPVCQLRLFRYYGASPGDRLGPAPPHHQDTFLFNKSVIKVSCAHTPLPHLYRTPALEGFKSRTRRTVFTGFVVTNVLV